MNNWLQKQNAYSIIKLLVMIAMFYSLISSLIFSLGGYANLSGYFSGSLCFYIGVILITYTPKGKMYFSPLFRLGVYILLFSRIFNMMDRFIDASIRDKYSAIFVFSITAFIFMVVGIYMGKYERKKK